MNVTGIAAVAVMSCLTVTVPFSAQRRPPIVESVDVSVPAAPVIVQSTGKATLVYELHVTNFNAVPVGLSRVQVLSTAQTPRLIADYRDEELRKRIGRPGLRRDQADRHVIGPGMRAVIYLWLELPDDAGAVAAVRHRLEVDVMRPAGAMRNVVEGSASSVSSEAPVVLAPPYAAGRGLRSTTRC